MPFAEGGIYQNFCTCGHSQIWHGGVGHLGKCDKQLYGKYSAHCSCFRFKSALKQRKRKKVT